MYVCVYSILMCGVLRLEFELQGIRCVGAPIRIITGTVTCAGRLSSYIETFVSTFKDKVLLCHDNVIYR
jgi:hypothetical protein